MLVCVFDIVFVGGGGGGGGGWWVVVVVAEALAIVVVAVDGGDGNGCGGFDGGVDGCVRSNDDGDGGPFALVSLFFFSQCIFQYRSRLLWHTQGRRLIRFWRGVSLSCILSQS